MRTAGVIALCLATGVGEAAAGGQSVSVVQAYRRMLQDAPILALAEDDMADAHLDHSAAWLEMSPSVHLDVETYRGFEAGYPLSDYLRGSGTLTQPLFRRSLFAALAAADSAEEGARLRALRAKQGLMFLVVDTLLRVELRRQLRSLARDAFKRTEAQLASASARVKAGGALRSAELLASIQVKAAEAREVQADRDVELAEAVYQRVTLSPPPESFVFPPTPTTPGLAEGLHRVEGRADVKAALQTIEEKQALVSVAAGHRLWPSLDLRAAGAYTMTNPPSDWAIIQQLPNGQPRPETWQLGAVMSWPLFQGGREFVEIQRKEIDVDRARARLDIQLRVAQQDVREAYDRHEAAQRSLRVAEERVRDAEDNYNLVTSQFRLGAITFLEVATAQGALTDALSSRIEAINQRDAAAYELVYATGDIDLESAP